MVRFIHVSNFVYQCLYVWSNGLPLMSKQISYLVFAADVTNTGFLSLLLY